MRVGTRELTVSSTTKVLYPATGTTKADVMRYYLEVAGVLMPHIARRPVTRKRWPDGVDNQSFFRKDLEDSAPDWIATADIQHKTTTNAYPLVDDPATLAWFAQVAALELHTPQWRFDADGNPRNPDRLVLDLDPGHGVTLAETAAVALVCKEILDGMGLTSVPVTSGSKGIHIYAALDGGSDATAVNQVAKALAHAIANEHPERVTATMRRTERAGKIFLDWSQNNGSKTTISPYSLRGRQRPTVAAPRTWEEIADPDLSHLEYDTVLQRIADGNDPLAQLHGAPIDAANAVASGEDKLATYRAMRNATKTSEPMPAGVPQPRSGAPIFVIGEHHARRLHWDFRLEHDGVLVSWAVPKGPPLDPSENRLAVQTEDHPIEYAWFEGTIPKGEYGAGTVEIFDIGTCEIEKWRNDEVIAVLHGRADGGLGGVPRRYALVRTSDGGSSDTTSQSTWLLKLMKRQPAPEVIASPMLATAATAADIALEQHDGVQYAFEMKWDGYRMIASVQGAGAKATDADATVRLTSRGGKNYTALFPYAGELVEICAAEGISGGVFDGELVAFGADGKPDFSLLHAVDKHATEKHSTSVPAAEATEIDLRYVVFDVLRLGEKDLTQKSYDSRRAALEALPTTEHVAVPVAYRGSFEAAWGAAEKLGLEGVVAKQRSSQYEPGQRSRAWLKVKRTLHQSVVVVGVREGKRGLASLLLAVPDEDGVLRYAGRVGTGFSNAQREAIAEKLKRAQRKTPPLEVPASDVKDAWWVTPKFVGEVALAGRTRENKVRHASWRGWRDDLTPKEVRWEI